MDFTKLSKVADSINATAPAKRKLRRGSRVNDSEISIDADGVNVNVTTEGAAPAAPEAPVAPMDDALAGAGPDLAGAEPMEGPKEPMGPEEPSPVGDAKKIDHENFLKLKNAVKHHHPQAEIDEIAANGYDDEEGDEKVGDSKKLANARLMKKIRDSKNFKSLKKRISDAFDDTETTDEAIDVAISNLDTNNENADEVVTAVIEVLSDIIEGLEGAATPDEVAEEVDFDTTEAADDIEEPAEDEITDGKAGITPQGEANRDARVSKTQINQRKSLSRGGELTKPSGAGKVSDGKTPTKTQVKKVQPKKK